MAKIFTINPGSTSTKIGIFEDDKLVIEQSLAHNPEELAKYSSVWEQIDFRKNILLKFLEDNNINIDDFDAVVGRGGLMKPIVSGTYEVSKAMLDDFTSAKYGEHASNLGAKLALELKGKKARAFIVDPVVVDELAPIARVSGQEGTERISIFHALNQKAVAKRFASETGKGYTELNLIVAHMGGGVSIGAHKKGMVVDVNNALDGDGPFSPERAGGIPVRDVIRIAYSGEFTEAQLRKHFVGKGGLMSYFGTQDAREVSKMAHEGDEKAQIVYEAMAYQIAKEIGACASVLEGNVDAILLTGGIAHDKEFVGWITKRIEWIAPVHAYPGEDELEALAQGGLRVLRGEEEAKTYA